MEGMCGKLNKALYGTRGAAQNWEHEYIDFLEKVGFQRGVSTPCIFWHRARDIRVVVHGDDFTILGDTGAGLVQGAHIWEIRGEGSGATWSGRR